MDYDETQESSGRMNLQTMQKSAEALYDYAATRYPGKKVIVMGHSYGCGMAAYLAGVRDCSRLIPGKTTCPVTVIGSDADTTLPAELQKKLAGCYADVKLKIFSGIRHEDYLTSTEVIQFIKHTI